MTTAEDEKRGREALARRRDDLRRPGGTRVAGAIRSAMERVAGVAERTRVRQARLMACEPCRDLAIRRDGPYAGHAALPRKEQAML